VDAAGLRWRGVWQSTEVAWSDVERLVLDDRTSPYGSAVDVVVQLANGQRHNLPSDAVNGLEDDKHAELRHNLFASITRCAEAASVAVTAAGPGDPLAP
jgi:hypothetical protein